MHRNCKSNKFICISLGFSVYLHSHSGEMLEWLKRHAWKACIRQNRISGSNPARLQGRVYKKAMICFEHISRFKSRCKGPAASGSGMRSYSEHNPAAFIRKLACRMMHKTAGICPWHISRCVPLQGPPGEGHGNAQRERAYVTRILCCPIRFRTNLWWIPPEERRFLTHNACLH